MTDPFAAPLTEHHERFTDTERMLAELWIEVLRITSAPQPADNFFALGGDSMAMVMLEFRIREQLGVALKPGTVLVAPTLRELSFIVTSTPQVDPPAFTSQVPDIAQ